MKEHIALQAWEMITRFSSLKKLNFFPSLIGMTWLLVMLTYQITFTYVVVFKKKDKFLQILSNFMHKDYFAEVLVGFGILFFLYIFIAPLAEWALVEMIHSYRKSNGQKLHRTFQGIFDGFRHFLPLFEAHNVISVFKPLAVVTFYILLLRLFGKEYFEPITYIMVTYLIFAFFINMCFSYAKFFIIFENKWVIQSLSYSTGMAVRHIGITLQLYYTMILLYLRTIIVGLIFLVLPFIISTVVTFFTIVSVQIVLLVIFGILSFVLFIFIVHLNSTLEIFVEATWYEAYQLCKKEDKEYSHDHGGHDDHGEGHDDHHGDDHGGHSDEHGDSHGHSDHGKSHDDHGHH
jgi:hypothetical protein